MYTPHPTPTVTLPEEWARLDACTRCLRGPGQPCVTLLDHRTPQERHRPHPERIHRADRDPHGLLLLALRAETAQSTLQPRMHFAVDGTAVCDGERLDLTTAQPWGFVELHEACGRMPCRRVWRAEVLR
jgi:hypothetical protein